MAKVGVKYKCYCMSEETTIQVPERKPAVDIIMWIESIVTPRVAVDHRKLAPHCRSTTMEFVKLPVPPDRQIGQSNEE